MSCLSITAAFHQDHFINVVAKVHVTVYRLCKVTCDEKCDQAIYINPRELKVVMWQDALLLRSDIRCLWLDSLILFQMWFANRELLLIFRSIHSLSDPIAICSLFVSVVGYICLQDQILVNQLILKNHMKFRDGWWIFLLVIASTLLQMLVVLITWSRN